jgi:hypothetical protein
MAMGPGKYDVLCTSARESAQAEAVVLIVLAGTHGNGFSVQSVNGDFLPHLPGILRQCADNIEQSYGKG